MARTAWEFWRISRKSDGRLEWFGATRRSTRAEIERGVVWTLVPARLAFLPNWFVSEDHQRVSDDAEWVHEWVDMPEARAIALGVPDPTREELIRLASPDAAASFGRLQRFDIESVLGTRVANKIAAR